jgi:FAD dependent oxidoreductase
MINTGKTSPDKKVSEPAKEINVYQETDVVVAGGGPAGVAAAIASARNGAETVLIERYGHLGGMATGGLVILIPHLSDGTNQPQIAGICHEIISRLDDLGGALHPRFEDLGSSDTKLVRHWQDYLFYVIGGKIRLSVLVDPEILKCVLNDMMEEAGVKLFLHSWSTQALVEDNVMRGVIFESKSGRQAVLSKIVIDSTGDGDIFASAGAPYDGKLDPKLRTASLALIFRVGNVDTGRFTMFMKEENQKYAEMMYELESLGGYSLVLRSEREDVVWFNNYLPKWVPNYTESFVTETPTRGLEKKSLSALNFEDLTWVEVNARKGMLITYEFFKKHVAGFENSYIINVASQVGTRGSRRLLGDYVVTEKDIRSGIVHDDTIVACPPLNGNVSPQHPHMCIPYRSLLPQKVENLLVAGRCFSSDLVANDLLNIIPPCIAMGQAAGTAAALAIKEGLSPRQIDYRSLQRNLIGQNVILPPAIKDDAQIEN